jgi:superfamily II DNA or RNA helicase/HKD family nuclease
VEGIGSGLFEAIVTDALAADLLRLDDSLVPYRSNLRAVDASDRIALHLSRAIERVLDSVPDTDRVEIGIGLARDIIDRLSRAGRSGVSGDAPIIPAEMLTAISSRRPDGTPEPVESPMIPLLDTTLLTNAPDEPRVGRQLLTEISSADRIDLVMAFVRRSGLRPLLDALRRHCERDRELRVLTTTFTGSTERQALDQLTSIGAEVRVSYETGDTRLHAKAWLFHRESGYSTSYIGSSNLTAWAQQTGLEWNVRVSEARNRDVISKVTAVFESYWSSIDFRSYSPEEFDLLTKSTTDTAPLLLSPVELRLEPFQERMLERIEIARRRDRHRNLLVSATGTGKTVMAAVDYCRLARVLPRARLLFVAHREELLDQARDTFRHALRDASFGEKWVGGQRPAAFEHVFASIQSLSASGLEHLVPAHFDVVIIDEFHHAAARTYDTLLHHLDPVELLGLTATPERADGLPVVHWFDDHIAAELRLWDAIDQHRLSPFEYYGVSDGLDLTDVPWRRGRGYDVEGLTNLYTADDAWARRVVASLDRYVDDVRCMKALGFCVSVEHARFMARHFNEAGISSVAVWGDSAAADREMALTRLARGDIQTVFSVDLFNEGVDVPVVDTLLMLRPTDSPTLFLQQLGRGLRKANDKRACTVLDYIGNHRKEFRFDRKYRALLGGSRRDLEQQVTGGFPFLPAGCHMDLDSVASAVVLRSIRDAIPSQWSAKLEELRALARIQTNVTLEEYLHETGLELEELYTGNRGWSDLRDQAGLSVLPPGPHEAELRRAAGRLLHVDDDVRLSCWAELLRLPGAPASAHLDERNRRLARMLVASVADTVLSKEDELDHGLRVLWSHPQVRSELLELFEALERNVEHLHWPLSTHAEAPLQVHARYTRREILAAFGVGDSAKVAPWQTGVYWAADAQADLFAFTLDKSSGNFSPTTRYRDYAISPELIHWESQSVTRARSETGLRYQQHVARGTSILLFARLRADDRAFWFLGPATYVSHESERPMQVTWRLEHRLPGDLFASFAAAVA